MRRQFAQLVERAAQLRRAFRDLLFELFVGPVQQPVGALALRNIGEGDDCAPDHAVIEDRVGGVLGGEAGAVGAPQHVAVDAAALALAEGAKDRAILDGVIAAVGARVMDQVMHVAAPELLGGIAQQLGPGAVDEGAAAIGIDAIDAIAGRFQQ